MAPTSEMPAATLAPRARIFAPDVEATGRRWSDAGMRGWAPPVADSVIVFSVLVVVAVFVVVFLDVRSGEWFGASRLGCHD